MHGKAPRLSGANHLQDRFHAPCLQVCTGGTARGAALNYRVIICLIIRQSEDVQGTERSCGSSFTWSLRSPESLSAWPDHTGSYPTPNMLLLLAPEVRQHTRCGASKWKDEP